MNKQTYWKYFIEYVGRPFTNKNVTARLNAYYCAKKKNYLAGNIWQTQAMALYVN